MTFNDLPIARKLAGSFAILMAVFAAVSLYLYSSLSALRQEADQQQSALVVSADAEKMLGLVLEQMNAVRGFVILGKPEFYETYQQKSDELDQLTSEARAKVGTSAQQAEIDAFNAAVQQWHKDKIAPTFALARNVATRDQARELAGAKQLKGIRDAMGVIVDTQKKRASALAVSENAAHDAARNALLIGGLSALAAAGLLAWLLGRGIARPVSAMTSVMRTLAAGDNDVEVPGANRGDEIGGMAKAVLVFRDTARAKAEADVAKARADAEQKLVVDSLQDRLRQLAAGDLTAEITEDFANSYAALKVDFNQTVRTLRSLIASVMQGAATIRSASSEVADASEHLARRAESNAASLEETSAAIANMDGRLKVSSDAAARTVTKADEAIATVSGGRSIADEAVQAMGRVSDSAKGIDGVIEGLDKIAFQTRVLAMNAAVEAGRAGDAGRGFAVVADLVSALAMRAEEEAKAARDQLTVTQADIVTAVDAVQRVDGALADISEGVSEVHSLLGQMASDNHAQSSAITQISVAIGTMDRSTQQNAAMVEETSAAARTLTSEAAGLADQASQFTVEPHGSAGRSVRPQRAAHTKPSLPSLAGIPA